MLIDVFDKVRDCIVDDSEILSKEDIKMESYFNEDLGMDSLDVVEVITDVEEVFDISIPDEDCERIKQVRDLVAYVNSVI